MTDLDSYLTICAEIIPTLRVEEAKRLAVAARKYYQGNQAARAELSKGQKLEKRWYASVANGTPDYGVYDDPFFVSDLWACWVVYSRGYVKAVQKLATRGILKSISSIADLGCGAGHTTAALAGLFSKAKVIGTNIPRTAQYRIAEAIGAECGFRMAASIGEPVDLVFASEYFEHFQEPIEHLRKVIRIAEPRYLVVANSFGARSIGHFNEYLDGSQVISNRKIGRRFNSFLQTTGYERVETGFWNNRPAVWQR